MVAIGVGVGVWVGEKVVGVDLKIVEEGLIREEFFGVKKNKERMTKIKRKGREINNHFIRE